MPVYEYACEAGHRFEVKQKFSDAPITTCQVCSLPVTKLISPSAISFKGAGWYVTDYSEKFKPPATQEKTAAAADTKTDTKNDTKTDSKKDSASGADTKSTSTDSGGSAASPSSTGSTTGSSPPTSTPSGS
jgi:putative FmdB family regulatory protein